LLEKLGLNSFFPKLISFLVTAVTSS
jgi:hypothetical protein